MKTASSIVVGHQQHRFGGQPVFDPQIEEIGANGLGGQHIESGKGFVQQQNGRLDDECAGKADALPHAARQLARIGGFEAVEADQIDRGQRTPPAFSGWHGERLEPRLDILQHRQPGKESEGLKHHRHAFGGAPDRSAAIDHLTAARPDQAGDDAQQGRFARSGTTEEADDLAPIQ
jgi:hypothetical protein